MFNDVIEKIERMELRWSITKVSRVYSAYLGWVGGPCFDGNGRTPEEALEAALESWISGNPAKAKEIQDNLLQAIRQSV